MNIAGGGSCRGSQAWRGLAELGACGWEADSSLLHMQKNLSRTSKCFNESTSQFTSRQNYFRSMKQCPFSTPTLMWLTLRMLQKIRLWSSCLHHKTHFLSLRKKSPMKKLFCQENKQSRSNYLGKSSPTCYCYAVNPRNAAHKSWIHYLACNEAITTHNRGDTDYWFQSCANLGTQCNSTSQVPNYKNFLLIIHFSKQKD